MADHTTTRKTDGPTPKWADLEQRIQNLRHEHEVAEKSVAVATAEVTRLTKALKQSELENLQLALDREDAQARIEALQNQNSTLERKLVSAIAQCHAAIGERDKALNVIAAAWALYDTTIKDVEATLRMALVDLEDAVGPVHGA